MKNIKFNILNLGLACCLLSACGVKNGSNVSTISGLSEAAFDTTINQKAVKLYTLNNKNGMEVCITNFGGRIVSLVVPDKNGKQTDVVLGYDNIAQYADSVNSPSDFGAAIGRYANRINKGKLQIAGKTYSYLQTIMDIACMEVHPDGNIRYMMPSNLMTRH